MLLASGDPRQVRSNRLRLHIPETVLLVSYYAVPGMIRMVISDSNSLNPSVLDTLVLRHEPLRPAPGLVPSVGFEQIYQFNLHSNNLNSCGTWSHMELAESEVL